MKTLFTFLAVILGIVAVIAGLAVGFGVFAYSIYLVILLCKGTVALTFWAVCKAVICFLGAALSGWLTFFVVMLFAGLCTAFAKACD
jgi:hypothetical protein